MIHPLIQPIFRIQIRPTTGRLLQMRTASPLRGVWVSTMAVSAAAVGRATTMSGAFEADSELVIWEFGYLLVPTLFAPLDFFSVSKGVNVGIYV